MNYRILGPLEVTRDDGPLPLGGAKQRALLALLLANANRVVPRERIIDELWGDEPPESAIPNLHTYVSRLRKVLPAARLLTRSPGYVLEVEAELVDLLRFERLLADARNADPEPASRLLHEALALWRGPALAEFDGTLAQVEAARLEDLRLAALEERIDADLALGLHARLTAELKILIAQRPHRERLRGQLMLALYRSDRQADALDAYRDARSALGELGIEPSAALRRLERQILTQDPSLDLPRDRLISAALGKRVPLPGPLVPVPPFPFVGRAAELEELRRLLERAEVGEGHFVLLGGEAGSGKTRLVREFAHEAAAQGVLVVYGVSDAAVSTPYQPLREWLEFLLRVSESAALAECLGESTLARLVPELGRLTGPPPATSDRDTDRYLLQSAAVKLLTRIGRVQPLLVVVDDLHWADNETLHLLRRVAHTAPEAPVLVAAAFRDRGEEIRPEVVELLGALARLEGVTRLALGNLSIDEVDAFIRASAEAEVTPELASELDELTDGTPLLLCELWRDLTESGAVEVRRSVHLSRSVAELRGPARIRDFVGHRLSRLASETRSVVETAAVVGQRVEVRVLGEAVGLQPAALIAALESTARAGLLEALPGLPPTWRFTHELVRRAVYDRLEPASLRLAELHLRVGEALERVHANDPSRVLPELAHHFTLAVPLVEVERAVAYNLRAAEAAMTSAAAQEGAARLSAALELGIADPRERARVQVDLAYLLGETRRGSEEDAMLAVGLEAATNLEERALAADALLQQAHLRLMADPGVDPKEVETVAKATIETFREIGNERDLALTERRLGLAIMCQGRVEEQCAALERALIHADASGDQRARRTVIASLVHAFFSGPAPVVDAIRRCEELLESSGSDRILEATVNRGLSAMVAMAGRFDEARELVRTSSLVLDELNFLTNSVYRPMAANAKELIGDRVGAEHELTAACQGLSGMRGDTVDARAMIAAYDLAQFYCDEGRWEDAERCLDYGRDVLEIKSFIVAVRRFAAFARVAANRGEHAQALELAHRGVELAERSDMLNLRARVWLALAEVQRHAGAEADARTAVATALDLYEQKGNVAAAAPLRAPARPAG